MDRIVEVAVKSAWWSKINWVSVVSMVAAALTAFGFDFPPEVQAKVAETIIGISGFLTIVLRTWFTTSVTIASAKKLES
jgi:hypothetical protein